MAEPSQIPETAALVTKADAQSYASGVLPMDRFVEVDLARTVVALYDEVERWKALAEDRNREIDLRTAKDRQARADRGTDHAD